MMHADVILVGGGLAGGLLGYLLANQHPDKRILLLEAQSALGGNHTWIFRESDVNNLAVLRPLISKTYQQFEVRFPKHNKLNDAAIHVIEAPHFHMTVLKSLGANARLSCRVKTIRATSVELENGESLCAPLVIDCTGPNNQNSTENTFCGSPCGWKKSVGFELHLENAHHLSAPILVDAVIPQMDGYRSFVCLPLESQRVYLEEVFYSAAPILNNNRTRLSILAYADRLGWKIKSVLREETSLVPLPLSTPQFDSLPPEAFLTSGEDFVSDDPIRVSPGYGWFNFTTGGQIADSVRIAEFISGLSELRIGAVRPRLRDFRASQSEQRSFYQLMNRLLFRVAEPGLRYQIFENIFALPPDLVGRFHSGQLSARDRSRILSSRPVLRADRVQRFEKEHPHNTTSAGTSSALSL